MIDARNWLTLVAGAAAVVAPQLVTFLPPGIREVATLALAFLTGVYHLYQPPPRGV